MTKKPKKVPNNPKGKNPYGNLRAGRVSKSKDKTVNGITIHSLTIGPHPRDADSYKGASPASIDDVVKLLKRVKRENGGSNVDVVIAAYGDWYKNRDANDKPVYEWFAIVHDLYQALDAAEDYAQSGFKPEELCEQLGFEDSAQFILQWSVSWS